MDIIVISLWYGTMLTILIRMLINSMYWRKVRKLTDKITYYQIFNYDENVICIRALRNMNLWDVYKPWKQIPLVKYYKMLKSMYDNHRCF